MKIMKIHSKNNCLFHFFHFRAFTIVVRRNQQEFNEGSVLIYFSAMLIDFGPPFESFGLQNGFPSHETTLFLQFFWNKARHQGYRLWTSIQEFLAPRSPPKKRNKLFLQFFWNNARHQWSIITMDPPRWLAYSLRATMRGGPFREQGPRDKTFTRES